MLFANHDEMIKAKFTDKTKRLIFERDEYKCIHCRLIKPLEAHHAYFGAQAQYDEGRNNVDRGVSLCVECHDKLHHTAEKKERRQHTLNYLTKLYGSKRENA